METRWASLSVCPCWLFIMETEFPLFWLQVTSQWTSRLQSDYYHSMFKLPIKEMAVELTAAIQNGSNIKVSTKTRWLGLWGNTQHCLHILMAQHSTEQASVPPLDELENVNKEEFTKWKPQTLWRAEEKEDSKAEHTNMVLPQDGMYGEHMMHSDLYQRIQCAHVAQGPATMVLWLQEIYVSLGFRPKAGKKPVKEKGLNSPDCLQVCTDEYWWHLLCHETTKWQ